LLSPGDRINDFDLLFLVQEDAVHANVGIDRNHIVIDEESLPHSTLVFVAINDVLKVGHRVGGGCCGQTDLDAIKVVEFGSLAEQAKKANAAAA
jgi:hypothetical protein